jgi:hypothetical protein
MRGVIAALAVLLASGPAVAQPPRGRAEPTERPVITSGAGPRKLRVDLPLLAGAQPFKRAAGVDGLADLRLFDQEGREVAYLLLSPPSQRRVWHPGTILPIAQTEKTSGFEVDIGTPRTIDAVSVEGLPPPFLKRLVLEASGDRAHWTMLVGEGTLLDLPAERVQQTSIGFVPGMYRYLRVTWDDTNSGRLPLPRRALAREAGSRPAPAPLLVPLSLQRQASEPARSRYRLQLPAAGLPIAALVLDVAGGDIFRVATALESRFGGTRAEPVELGRARLIRQEGTTQALRLPVQRPEGTEIQLVIDDGSNPPLGIAAVSAEIADLPWIYFEAPAGPVTARYGNPTLPPPQYDLEARRAAVDLDSVPEASWGDPRAGRGAATAPPPAAVPGRGAQLEARAFQHRRRLAAEDPGLVALQLDAAVLAHSRGPDDGFADVRIVDAESYQIPYLVERRDEPLSIDLALRQGSTQVTSLREGGRRSLYAIAVPYADLPPARLVLETSDRIFRRQVRVGIERPPDRRRREPWYDVVVSSTWQHVDASTPAPALELAVQAGQATELLVVVEEGDNRPLTITGARLLLPSWRLRFFQPAGPLHLVYGRDDASAPQYDLALLAPAVMGAEARGVVAEPETTAAPTPPAGMLSPRLFWVGLGLAVVVLLGLIVRLISSGTAPPPSPPRP